MINEESEKYIVNIYNINENNFYGCHHVQLDVGVGKLTTVFEWGEKNSLMPGGILRIC